MGAPSARTKMIRAGYEGLGMIQFFTAGEDEVKCWTIFRGIKAPQAAGVVDPVHEEHFTSVNVATSADLERLGSIEAVKEAGLFKARGADYEI